MLSSDYVAVLCDLYDNKCLFLWYILLVCILAYLLWALIRSYLESSAQFDLVIYTQWKEEVASNLSGFLTQKYCSILLHVSLIIL